MVKVYGKTISNRQTDTQTDYRNPCACAPRISTLNLCAINSLLDIHNMQCHHVKALDAFFEGIQSEPVKLAVIGSGCSVATEPVAEISHRWNISQVLK